MATSKTATIIFKGEDQISPAIKGATASVAGLSQSFTGIENASNKTAAQIKAELTKAIASVNNELASLSKQKLTPDVQLKQNNALQQLASLKAKLNEIDKVVVKPQVDPESLLKSQLQAQALGQLVGKLNELKSASLDAFGEFKKAQRNTATQATDINSLSTAVKGLGADLKNQVSSTQLLDNAGKVAQKGYRDTADNINVLRATQKLAIATNTDFNTALEATTDILKAYNLPSTEAANVTALIDATATKAGTSVSELAPQIGKLASTSSTAGVSVNDLLGFIGKAGAKSVDARTSVGTLNKVINDLSTGDLVKKGQEIGVSFDAAAIKTGGLNEFLNQLKANSLTSADSLQKLGFNGKEAAAIQASLASGIDKVAVSQDGLNKKLEVKFDPKLSAENQLNQSLIELGKTIAPIANQVVLATRAILVAFTQLPEPIQQTLGALLGVVGLGSAVVLAFGAIAQAGGIVVGSVGAIQAALTTYSATAAAATGLTAAEAAAFGAAGANATGASVGVGTLTTATTGLTSAASAALIPLGLLVAAIAGAQFAKYANDIKAFNEELDNATAGTTGEANATFALGTKLRNLNEQRKAGKEISEQQRQGLLKLADDELKVQKQKLAAINALKPATDEQRISQAAEKVALENTIKAIENQRNALAENIVVADSKAKANVAIARSEKDVEAAVKSRVEAEKRVNENQAKARSRDFDAAAKSESRAFEAQSRDEKRVFEAQLNADKKAFENGQKADKDKFEKDLQSQQRAFNDAEKSKDQSYQRSKQDLERAFNAQQQAAKEAFDKKQQQASKDFDAKQNAEKKTADDQFAQRRLEIERKLQLDAAKSPEDRSKLEAEFAAADAKNAKEKEAFVQLRADEEAFAKKQLADKQAFDDAQKLAAQNFEKAQQADKLAFDDAIKAKDQAYEKQKEVAKLAFEDTLKAKKDALEAGQNEIKQAFEEQQTLKKQAFEDAERAKKDAFEISQNEKKAAFEDSERAKKQAFEDSLKQLEAQFKADERAKDIANAQQVAAIKNSAPAPNGSGLLAQGLIGVSARAKGGRFDNGQQLLVGERGAELVTFGSSGYVSNATDTKNILSSNSAPSGVSTARMEALLSQLVGKMDRPNIAVQTSENPSDVVVKVQREIARAAAMSSGI